MIEYLKKIHFCIAVKLIASIIHISAAPEMQAIKSQKIMWNIFCSMPIHIT